ncbi:MAG TPA: universal stress protein [Chthoniobacterales bacterium]|jgi:nucleotide-binding universal stress UspA family protein
MSETPYRSIAVAAAFSPRFHQVLAEANRVRLRFGASLGMIYVGKKTVATTQRFAAAIAQLRLPSDSVVHYEEGDPGASILAAACKMKVDLIVAGALEKEAVHRQFLGNVARRLVREACCSVMLFTQPELEPRPLRHIVFLAEYSAHAQGALRRTIRLAEQEKTERLYVIRNYTSFDKARAARRSKTSRMSTDRTLEEEELALQEFILAAGPTPVPIEARCIRGNTGFAASNFVQSVEADLLVVPWEIKSSPEPTLPSQADWVTDVIPCNLWIVRER